MTETFADFYKKNSEVECKRSGAVLTLHSSWFWKACYFYFRFPQACFYEEQVHIQFIFQTRLLNIISNKECQT